ncbi:MAG: hypothetical protein H7Y09_11510, partial [Chitinophagaceae bacterium]|nr:hypothetical protein [Anaerolineae bacterium]
MKRLLHYRVLLIFCVSLLLLVGLAPVQAQADNLLTNPGFEPPYNTLDGDPERTVADGWSPWHITRTDGVTVYGLPQPEYQEVAPNADRIRSDSNAQEIFGTFANPVGGVFQRVVEGITPQAEYRFSLYAWVWSTSREDILDESEDDADVTVEVGIDPTGGTDATSSAIQWSLPAEQYDAYRQYSVTATATSNAVTVFVRIKIRDPKARTSVYL